MGQAEATKRFIKYLHKGHGIALRGSIRKPYFQNIGEHAVASTYAGSPGISKASVERFTVGREIAYDLAVSQVTSDRTGNIFRMVIESRIENLRIGSRFTAKKVVAMLESQYDPASYAARKHSRILPAGSRFEGVMLDGKPLKLDVPTVFNATPAQRRDFFLGKYDNDPKFHPGFIPEPIRVPDFGTIFYAEWVWDHPDEKHQQHLVMFRLALGSDLGADLDAAFVEGDGKGWPP
jgi:hypothetical protein